MADKTHWKKCVADSPYIGEADFQQGEEKVAVILRVAEYEKVQTAEGSSEKAVVHFEGGIKPLILNVTNSKAITKAVGSPYFEDWCGHAIQLYVQPNVRAFGEVVNAVRVRPCKPILKAAPKCAACGNEVRGTATHSASYISTYTNRKFGQVLCFDCASRQAEQKQEGADEDAGTE